MYKTFPGTTYPSCIFHESELDLKHINIKIPRSIFLKKGHVSKNTKRPVSARPPHVPPNPHPVCSAPVSLLMPVFRWPLLTSRSLPVILFTFLSFLLSLHFLPSLPPLPLDPFILPCNHLRWNSNHLCTVLPVCLSQGLLLFLLHPTEGAQRCRIEIPETMKIGVAGNLGGPC